MKLFFRRKPPVIEVWNDILLGVNSREDLLANLWTNSVVFDEITKRTIKDPSFPLSDQAIKVHLAKINGTWLGFRRPALRVKIYQRAMEYGLTLCPLEVAIQLRLQHVVQPEGEKLLVATEPVWSYGSLRLFRVDRINTLKWLSAVCDSTNYTWPLSQDWVFAIPIGLLL